jgi:membrane protease YdiL (CAAX protease family)
LLPVLIGHLFAAIIWFLIYGLKVIGFWWGIGVAAGLLAIWSIIWAGEDRKTIFTFKLSYVLWGIVSATILYFIFWLGGIISTGLFSSAVGEIDAIYAVRERIPIWLMTLLLILIGSSEEIFWRGMAQRIFGKWFGKNPGWILAAIAYMSIDLWSLNLILIVASLIAGLYWGWLYKRFGSLWPAIISHMLWDLAIFLVFPLR